MGNPCKKEITPRVPTSSQMPCAEILVTSTSEVPMSSGSEFILIHFDYPRRSCSASFRCRRAYGRGCNSGGRRPRLLSRLREMCPAGNLGLCWSGVCSKPDPKMRRLACAVAGYREAWNDWPKVWNSDTSWLASLRRICSKRLTASFEYKRSPHRRQTSAPTVTDARLTPPRSSFSTSFRSISPPHTGHVLNGIIFVSLFISASALSFQLTRVVYIATRVSVSPAARAFM